LPGVVSQMAPFPFSSPLRAESGAVPSFFSGLFFLFLRVEALFFSPSHTQEDGVSSPCTAAFVQTFTRHQSVPFSLTPEGAPFCLFFPSFFRPEGDTCAFSLLLLSAGRGTFRPFPGHCAQVLLLRFPQTASLFPHFSLFFHARGGEEARYAIFSERGWKEESSPPIPLVDEIVFSPSCCTLHFSLAFFLQGAKRIPLPLSSSAKSDASPLCRRHRPFSLLSPFSREES